MNDGRSQTPEENQTQPESTQFDETSVEDSYAEAPLEQFAGNDSARPYNGKPIINWTASEFIAHHKTAGWYGALAAGALILAALVFLITKDKISTATVVVCGLIFGIYAGRQPRQLQYQLDDKGLSIGDKQYGFGQFRSFGVTEEGMFTTIVLMPLRRFAPLLTIYIDPADETPIVDLLAEHLPFEEHKFDVVDRFMKRIRF